MERMLGLSRRDPLSMLMLKFGIMSRDNDSCGLKNCSGHGECQNGICLCEIQFEGERCHAPNLSYYLAFASLFFVLAFVSLSQLLTCVLSEWRRMKKPSLLLACRASTQKILYLVVFLASLMRAAYFISQTSFMPRWSSILESVYYPLVLTGFSLVVCFWAEVFHVKRVTSAESPKFLSKSYLAFVVFNIITYALLGVELLSAQLLEHKYQDSLKHIFNACYAFLLFVVLVLFLIYGIEVFFKVRGRFVSGKRIKLPPASSASEDDAAASAELFKCSPILEDQQVNTSQLHQSRFGLLSQALMLFVALTFLLSKTLSEFWQTKVPLNSRNWHDVVLRLIELGIVMWFSCVLWNCIYPEQLWILNPRRILRAKDEEEEEEEEEEEPSSGQRRHSKEIELQEKSELPESRLLAGADCWICYDPERRDAGPLIQPCRCSGDVAAVHHDCLRRWLVESSRDVENLACKVCGTRYNVEQSSRLDWQTSLGPRYWFRMAGIIATMCGSFAAAWIVIQLVDDPYTKMLASASAVLIIYVCVRFLSLNTVVACQRAKISSLNIINAELATEAQVSTISRGVSINLIG